MSNQEINYVLPPRPLGGKHLNLLWFLVTRVLVDIHVRLCQTLITQYFVQFFPNGFKFSDMVTMEKT